MSLSIDEFFRVLAIKRYYEFKNSLFNNYIEDLFLSQDKNVFKLISIKYDKQEVCRTINGWINKYNSDLRDKWYGFACNDIEHITVNMDVVERFRSINFSLLEKISGINYDQIVSYIYIYCGFELYYDGFCNRAVYNQTKIKEMYNRKLYDNDFVKWGLIPVSDKRKFVDDRIFDVENKKTIHLSLKSDLLEIFHKLIDNKTIKSISLRSDDRIEDGIIQNDTLCEGVAKGTMFNIKHLNFSKETIVFSNRNFNNQLWVFTDDNNLTFEELLDDFKCDDNSIVTQMIHVQFFYEEGSNIPYITHIDKENIFYTPEEYEERLKTNTKGNAKKREKFFKINDSKIKFDYPCEIIECKISEKPKEISVPFIYFIVRYFFKNKDIVDEYFSSFK